MKFDDDVMSELPTPKQVDRMAEVFCAIEDFLKVLPSGDLGDHDHLDADLEKLCAEVGESLYKKYGISIKFPTETEDYTFEKKERGDKK